MKKQKICIIGGSLTGLVTAISLSKLNCTIDLIPGNIIENMKSNRTIAISENNLNFLKKLNITKYIEKEMWDCSIMKLYSEEKNKKISKVFELNKEKSEKKILYLIKNSKIMKLMMNRIKNIKSISVKNYKKVSSISDFGLLKKVKFDKDASLYNLVIICAGNNSGLIKNIFNNKLIKNSYKETAITTILKHNSFCNNTVRQIFLKNQILAFLPISNIKTSVVWSVKNKMKKNNNFFLKKELQFYAKNFFKNIKFESKFEYKDLSFVIRNKYFDNRVLLFGDALHLIHPFSGQGFNMTIRDLVSLEKILYEKINLGLDIGSTDILSEFTRETKSRNFAFSFGLDILKNSFSIKKFRNDVVKVVNKSNFAKNILFNIADKGLRF